MIDKIRKATVKNEDRNKKEDSEERDGNTTIMKVEMQSEGNKEMSEEVGAIRRTK